MGLPGPVFVDDFYYDYNFINFHEDLSYGIFEEPDTDLTGDWMPPPLSSPPEPPTGTPVPATEPPGAEKEGAVPGPRWAGHSPPPPSEQTPGNPQLNFLSEEDAPIGAPDPGLPSLLWPPTPVSLETPVPPGNQTSFPGGEHSQGQPPLPPPQGERTNEVSEDNDEATGHKAPYLPQKPSPTSPSLPSISTTHSSGPNMVELWTGKVVAWDPALDSGLGPQPPPTAALPDTWGTDSPLEPGSPTLSTPRMALQDLQTGAVPGTFLRTAPTGLGNTPWVTALSPGPLGQPESPNSDESPGPVLLSIPAQDSLANSSRAPAPLVPSPTEAEAPVYLPAARNASWEVGNWSEASGAGAGCGWGGEQDPGGEQSLVCLPPRELTACGGHRLCKQGGMLPGSVILPSVSSWGQSAHQASVSLLSSRAGRGMWPWMPRAQS